MAEYLADTPTMVWQRWAARYVPGGAGGNMVGVTLGFEKIGGPGAGTGAGAGDGGGNGGVCSGGGAGGGVEGGGNSASRRGGTRTRTRPRFEFMVLIADLDDAFRVGRAHVSKDPELAPVPSRTVPLSPPPPPPRIWGSFLSF